MRFSGAPLGARSARRWDGARLGISSPLNIDRYRSPPQHVISKHTHDVAICRRLRSFRGVCFQMSLQPVGRVAPACRGRSNALAEEGKRGHGHFVWHWALEAKALANT